MPAVKVMYWKDIPVSVRVEEGRRNRIIRKLPDIYMSIVDAVAMKEGSVGSDEYQAAFVWSEPEQRQGTLEEVADAVVAEILARYPKEWLLKRSKQAGVASDTIADANQ